MFILKHFKGREEIKAKEYETREEAEDHIEDDAIDADRYQIYDTAERRAIDDGYLESSDSKNDSTMDLMFPNKDEDY